MSAVISGQRFPVRGTLARRRRDCLTSERTVPRDGHQLARGFANPQRAAIGSFQDPEDVRDLLAAAAGRPPPADHSPFPYITLSQPDVQAKAYAPPTG